MYCMHLLGGQSITIDKASLGPGPHSLAVTITTDNGGSVIYQRLEFNGTYTVFMLMKISVIGLLILYLNVECVDLIYQKIVQNLES